MCNHLEKLTTLVNDSIITYAQNSHSSTNNASGNKAISTLFLDRLLDCL